MPFNTWTPELMQLVWDNGVIGLAFISTDGTWQRANPAMCQMLGYTEDELKVRKISDVTDPSDSAAEAEAVKSVIAGTIPSYRMFKRFISKYGAKTLLAEVTMLACYTPSKEHVAFMFCQSLPVQGDVQNIRIMTDDEDAAAAIRFARRHWKMIIAILAVIIGSTTLREILSIIKMVTTTPVP